MTGNRIHYIDILKGLGIMFVVWAHCNTLLLGGGYFQSFHMAMFFFISGLLMNTDKYTNYKSFFLSRVKSLYVPYFLFYIVSYLYWLAVERPFRFFPITPRDGFIGLFYGTDNYHWIFPAGVLWFIIALFSLELVVFPLLKYLKSWWTRGLVFAVLTLAGLLLARYKMYFLPLSLNNALLVIPYFVMGYLLRKPLVTDADSYQIKKPIQMTTLLALLIVTVFFFPYICTIGRQTDIGGLTHPRYYIFYTLPFLSISLWLLFSMLVSKNKTLEWFGRNTLPIMAFHPPISRGLIYVSHILWGVDRYFIREDYLWSTCLCIATILLCLPLAYLWSKTYPKILALLFGEPIIADTK